MSSVFDKAIATAMLPFVSSASEQIAAELNDLSQEDGFSDRIRRRASQELTTAVERHYLDRSAPRFAGPIEFFDDYLRPAYEIGGASQAKGWCPEWTRHNSAVLRVTAMWNAYEALYQVNKTTCDEEFLRRVGDHHMEYLLGEKSSMLACTTAHRPSRPLMSTPADEERSRDADTH